MDEKALEVVAKLNLLNPVLIGEDESAKEFAERMRGDFNADLESGAFEAVEIDFSTPTDMPIEACEGIADYSMLDGLIRDVTDAYSFDKWLQERIDKALADSLAAHMAEL